MNFLDTCIEKMEEGIAKKVVLPKAIVLKMIPQLQEFISAPLDEHLFTSPIRNFPADLSAADKTRIEAAYNSFVVGELVPKYKALDSVAKRQDSQVYPTGKKPMIIL